MKANRQKEILDITDRAEIISYSDLAQELGVSIMTIRRDINELEKQQKIIKEHGGVRKVTRVKPTYEKLTLNTKEKEEIAVTANAMIRPDSVIYLGAGTTILSLAKRLRNDHKHIITNSLITFNWLIDHHFKNVHLTGGEFYPKTAEFHGLHAEKLIQNFSIDYAFLATNGVSENNMTTFSPSAGRLQTEVMKQTKETYLVIDHTKFGKSDSYIFGKLDQLTAIITNKDVSSATKEHYEAYTPIIS